MKCLNEICFAEISDVKEYTDIELDKLWTEHDELPIPIMNEEQWEAFDNDKIPFAYVEEIHPYPVTLLLHWCWITEKFSVLGLPEDAVDILEKIEFIEYEGEMVKNIIPTFETYDQALNFIMKYLQQK